MKFRQHIPNFAEGFKPFHTEGTIANILTHKQIRFWLKEPGFVEFAYAESGDRSWPAHLMAVLKTEYWVIGYLNEIPNLPKWEPPTMVELGLCAEIKSIQLSVEERLAIEERMTNLARNS